MTIDIDVIHMQITEVADEIMDAEYALSEKRKQRDALIVAGYAAGLSSRRIADACMLSHTTILTIVERAASANATTALSAGRRV